MLSGGENWISLLNCGATAAYVLQFDAVIWLACTAKLSRFHLLNRGDLAFYIFYLLDPPCFSLC